jgi:hypothetical protein
MNGMVSQAYTQMPQGIANRLAEKMRGEPEEAFQRTLEARIDEMRAALLDQGYPAPATNEICQAVRREAQGAWGQHHPQT